MEIQVQFQTPTGKMEQSGDESIPDNVTCLTGNTSEHSYAIENIRRFGLRQPQASAGGGGGLAEKIPIRMRCGRYLWLLLVGLLSLTALLTPLLMIALPKAVVLAQQWTGTNGSQQQGRLSGLANWTTDACQVDCQGQLLSLAFKWLILLIGVWALFGRRALADLPRLQLGRASLMAFVFLLPPVFAYWLFYLVRVVQPLERDYGAVVSFALSLVDALLFVHYLAIVLLELRQLRPEFKVRVVRSPDGESRVYQLGFQSIQQAALHVLQHYYRDFPLYNPFLEKLPGGGRRMGHKGSGDRDGRGGNGGGGGGGGGGSSGGGFKLYNVDGGADPTMAEGHNERFYEELDWERRVKKRKARLLGAAEDAFGHVAAMYGSQQQQPKNTVPCVPMDAGEAGQAIFPALARPLTKYLRVTRQQPRHSADAVVSHLSRCLAFDMSPKAFLERFFSPIETTEGSRKRVSWSIVCEPLASVGIGQDTTFLLRCHSEDGDLVEGNVQLLCTVSKLPFFNLKEELHDPKQQRFTLKLSSETSV